MMKEWRCINCYGDLCSCRCDDMDFREVEEIQVDLHSSVCGKCHARRGTVTSPEALGFIGQLNMAAERMAATEHAVDESTDDDDDDTTVYRAGCHCPECVAIRKDLEARRARNVVTHDPNATRAERQGGTKVHGIRVYDPNGGRG